MTRILAIIILCHLFLPAYTFAQRGADTLEVALKRPGLEKGERILLMGKYASVLFFRGQQEEAYQVLREQLIRARSMPDGKYAAYLYGIRAMSLRIADQQDAAGKDLDSALLFVTHTHDPRIKGYIAYCKGWIHSRNNQPADAVNSFIDGLKILDAAGINDYKGAIYNELYSIYAEWNDYQTQEKYARLNMALAQRNHNVNDLFNAYRMMGTSYEYQYRNNGLSTASLDSAYRYYSLALRHYEKNASMMEAASDYAFIAINMANIFTQFEAYRQRDSALKYTRLGLDDALRTKQYSFAANAYGILSQFKEAEGDYKSAKDLMQQALYYLQQEPIYDNNIMYSTFRRLSELSERDGDHAQALHYYKQYMKIYQEAYDAEKMTTGKELEARYEAEKKEKQLAIMQLNAVRNEKEIDHLHFLDASKAQQLSFLKLQGEKNKQQLALAHLEAQRKAQQLRAVQEKMLYNRRLNTVYILLIVATLLVLGFMIYAYRQRSRNMRQQSRMHSMEIQRLSKDNEITALSAMLNGEEKERARLARDLHDGLGGLLSGTKIELSGMLPMLEQEVQQRLLRKSLGRIDAAVAELRLVAHNLMPDLLVKQGLVAAVQYYCESIGNVTVQIVGLQKQMDQVKEIVVYRIIQELVNNAIKHAQAGAILVQLQQNDNQLFLTVEDDGVGFDISQAGHARSAGLLNIHSRIAYLKGNIQFHSAPGEGTAVEINIPIN